MKRCMNKRGGIRSLTLLLDLPESVFLEILYRLPVKSVFRLKSVCKRWLSMISDPCFATSYSCRRTKFISTFLYRYKGASYRTRENMRGFSLQDLWPSVLHRRHPLFRSPKFNLRFLSKHFKFVFNFEIIDHTNQTTGNVKAPVVVQAVSNGLLLSASTLMFHDYYYIINPYTQQYSTLPKPLRLHQLRTFYLLEYGWRVIAFDPEQVAKNDEETIIQCLLIDLPADHDIRYERSASMIAVCEDKNLLRYCHVTDIPLIQTLRVWELRKTEEKEHYWCFLHQIRLDNLIMSIRENVRVLAVDTIDPDIVYLRNQTTMILTRLNLKTGVFKCLLTFKSAMYPWTFFPYVLPPWPTPVPRFTCP